VFRGNAKVEASAGARLPFRNLVAILKPWIKDINRATPHPSPIKSIIRVQFDSREQFNRGEVISFTGHVVPEKHRLFKSIGPQSRIKSIWPV
jgi:hypothetical protein